MNGGSLGVARHHCIKTGPKELEQLLPILEQ